jgi:glyoxylase-like metal-dependent hydrolase (beta-lactamase superfamily II)
LGSKDVALFTGDAIFMPDSGTGRCDFPQGSARDLYHSISKKIYAFPDTTPIYVGHDYQPGGRSLMFVTTVGEQKKNNIHIKADTKLETYVEFRETRDKTLAAPRLLLPSLQINMRAGHWLAPGESGPAFLKLPLKIQLKTQSRAKL